MSHSLLLSLYPPYERFYPRRYLFTPGEKISGKVTLNLKEHATIDRIFLDFKGRCLVHDGGGDNENSYVEIMFQTTKELFRGPFKLQAAVYEYPFELYFPEKFDFKSTRWPVNTLFEAERGLLPLPPSLERGLSTITYRLKVKIPRSFGDWKDKIHLHFTPFRKDFNPASNPQLSKDNTIFYRNYKLTSEGIPRPFTKAEVLMRTFHKSPSNQTFGFSLSATAPTSIILGKPYPIEVTVIPTTTDVWENSPEVRLKYHILSLKGKTSVRVPCGTSESTGSGLFDHQLSAGPCDVALVPNKTLKLTGMFTKRLAQPTVPIFTSFGAKLTYGLKLKITVSCLGEDSEFKIKWPEIKVYPSKMEPGLEDAMRAVEDGSMILGEDDQVGLPSYSSEIQAGVIEELPAYWK
jgi:hypothetical protein